MAFAPSRHERGMRRRFARVAAAGALGVLASLSAGCEQTVIEGGERGEGGAAPVVVASPVTEIDLLISVDGSRSMDDKQQLLAPAITELIETLIEEHPDMSIHVGVVSSSLGDYGADTCPSDVYPENDDRGHLVDRSNGGGTVLAYGPGDDASAFGRSVADLVVGVGQSGCGYEAQLESWYRFLVDPEPYETVEVDETGTPTLVGIDAELLAQRAAFLRPNSLVAVVMLTDENDCSVQPAFSSVLRGKSDSGTNFRMPRARTECATSPDDPCCASCAQPTPAGCAVDPSCESSPMLTPEEDHINLRCFDQKRRFGMDLLHPVQRYVDGLTAAVVPSRDGSMVDNPLLAGGRDPSRVLLAGIVGVPWQDVARDPYDASAGIKTAAELAADGHWEMILGPAGGEPTDPLMRESTSLRQGVHPLLGVPVATPVTPMQNPINGHDYTIAQSDDLQYACIGALAEARDCALDETGCDCTVADNDNPLCSANPSDPVDPANRTLQTSYKAFPGRRELEVLRGLGDQAIVSSICAPQIADVAAADYGYRPAVSALHARMITALETP